MLAKAQVHVLASLNAVMHVLVVNEHKQFVLLAEESMYMIGASEQTQHNAHGTQASDELAANTLTACHNT